MGSLQKNMVLFRTKSEPIVEMSDSPDRFAQLLADFVHRSAYTAGQLATLSSVPKTTIINWLNGRVRRPRGWHGILSLAVAMKLTEAEVDQLLDTVGQPTVQELRLLTTDSESQTLLSFWQSTDATQRLSHSTPFQAIALAPTFVGRETELATLGQALSAVHHNTIYCLFGMAGVGKTTLAAQLAYQLRSHFTDGVLWARLDGSNTMSILATFAQAYQQDVSRFTDVLGRSRVVRSLLQGKRVLIVLDNATTSEQIEPLLPPTGRCVVIVTTRRHDLAVLVGAQRFEVLPFSAESTASLALFSRILGDERVQAEAATYKQIAQLLGHHPLALTIAASRLAYESGWEVRQFSEQLQQVAFRLPALRFEVQSVWRSFDLSHRSLTSASKLIFAAIGRLGRHDFSAEPLISCTNLMPEIVADGLRELHNLSLVQSVGGGRYQLHPLLHDFAQSLPVDADLPVKLVRWWQQLVANRSEDRAALRCEMPHITASITLAIAMQQHNTLWQLLDHLTPRLLEWGAYSQAADFLQQAITLLENGNNTTGLIQLLLRRGQLARQQQQLPQAVQYLQHGLSLAQAQQNQTQITHFLTELGIVNNCIGDYEQGKLYLLKALPLARQAPPNESLLALLEELGVLATIESNKDRAQVYYQEGYNTAVSLGKVVQQVIFLKSLGALRHLAQDRMMAKKLFTQGYMLAKQIDFRKGMMLLNNNLGVVAYYEGAMAEADAHLQMALDEAEHLYDVQASKLILDNLAGWAWQNDLPDRSRTYLRRLQTLAQSNGWPDVESHVHLRLEKMSEARLIDSLEHLRIFI